MRRRWRKQGRSFLVSSFEQADASGDGCHGDGVVDIAARENLDGGIADCDDDGQDSEDGSLHGVICLVY